MKFALICPEFSPEPGGLADYVERLSDELCRQDHEVRIWAAPENPLMRPRIPVSSHSRPWNGSTFTQIEAELREFAPDAVAIQFTPYLYGRRGLNPFLPLWLLGLEHRLRRANPRCRLGLMVHELHYPLGWSADRLVLGSSQFAQFLALFAIAPRVAFTNEIPYSRFARLAAGKSLAWIPAGTSIVPESPSTAGDTPRPESEKILLQFGATHPSRLFRPVFESLARAIEAGIPARLVLLGASPEAVAKKLAEEGQESLRPHVTGTGYLSAPETSRWLQRADVVLSPFSDGISARRSSAITAFAHGKAVVTTRGYLTDPSIPWQSFCQLSNVEDTQAFTDDVIALLQNPPLAAALGQAAGKVFETTFSWPVLVQKTLTWLQ